MYLGYLFHYVYGTLRSIFNCYVECSFRMRSVDDVMFVMSWHNSTARICVNVKVWVMLNISEWIYAIYLFVFQSAKLCCISIHREFNAVYTVTIDYSIFASMKSLGSSSTHVNAIFHFQYVPLQMRPFCCFHSSFVRCYRL